LRGESGIYCGWRFLRRSSQNPRARSTRNAITATPAPIPALIPDERLLRLGDVDAAGTDFDEAGREVEVAGVLVEVLAVEGMLTDEKLASLIEPF
jgi:hypothetical protein